LNHYITAIGTFAGTAAVDWERYEMFRVEQPSNHAGRVGVIVPKNFQQWDFLLDKIRDASQFEWHLLAGFTDAPEKQFCDAIGKCENVRARTFRDKREELLMLFGLPEEAGLRFILNDKLLSPDQAAQILGFGDFPA
jgi:hypothetical protein